MSNGRRKNRAKRNTRVYVLYKRRGAKKAADHNYDVVYVGMAS